MKFGKELKKQKVPEWTEAYVDYNGLKRILQEIRSFKQCQQSPTPSGDSLNMLVKDFMDPNMHNKDPSTQADIENQVIAVNSEQQHNSRKIYKTKLLAFPEGGENEIKFFRKLDDELNKTNYFFKDKVEEVPREAALLGKQMDALIALRIKAMNPSFDGSGSLKCLNTDISNLAPSKITFPGRADTFGTKQMDRGSNAEIKCTSLLNPGSPGSIIAWTCKATLRVGICYLLHFVGRFFEGEDYTGHGFNGLRYFLTIVAVVIRTAFELRKRLTWKVLAVVRSAIATLGNTYWDIVVDWGLLQRNTKNLFLRDKLLVSHKSVYFAAMVLDVLLRFAWLQVVLTLICNLYTEWPYQQYLHV